MKKKYKLPIKGTVLNNKPLKGLAEDPICVIPLKDLPNFPTVLNPETQKLRSEGFGFTCLDYNIDEEWCEVELEASEAFHNWLASILPQLNDIQKAKGWKLDKTLIEKVK